MSNDPLLPRNDYTSVGQRADATANAAVELIRNKVAQAYRSEPDASQELAEIQHEKVLTKHQKYMQELSSSGKSLAEIQTAWHHYYVMLPDEEKHEVWQEFYAANQHTPYQKLFQKQVPVHGRSLPKPVEHAEVVAELEQPAIAQGVPAGPTVSFAQMSPEQLLPTAVEKRIQKRAKPQSKAGKKAQQILDKPAVAKLKHKIVNRVSAGGKLQAKHHFQSLLFGLGTGFVVIAILLFSFFNDYIIAPFIQPSRKVSATPIILSDSQTDASKVQVIIPKINVQAPLDFTLTSDDESTFQNALENGVVHYPTTSVPGQNGNAAFFGHSSNNIFNPGHFKFIFTLLHTLNTGDTFYVSYGGKLYGYQVFAREVVPPSQVSVLTDTRGKTATVTLITCDPPGTSNNRLVVWGEQISPAVSTNGASQTPATTKAVAPPRQLASNGPSLWSRLVRDVQFWR